MEILRQQGFTDMLRDEDRNSKYYEALCRAIKARHAKGGRAIVLDIGTGAGLLAMMAAKAGADKVYACEMEPFMANCAKKVIRANNFQKSIVVIAKKSTNIKVGRGHDMPVRANILVTEIFATSLLYEEAIETFNHANANLLTDDCIVIPQKAIMYAQVVDCPYYEGYNTINPITLPNGNTVTFPAEMARCSNNATSADWDTQLSPLPTSAFKKLSDILTIFEFKWKEKLANQGSNKVEFISNRSGDANAIFCWWELQMDDSEKNVISVRPTWAGGSVWRYHWAQTVHYGQTAVALKEGNQCFLQCFHDDIDFWFRITRQDSASIIPPGKKQCKCLMHCLLNASRPGVINDAAISSKYVSALASVIKPGKTVCLCLSEPEGSVLYLIAAKLGAKIVFVIETASKTENELARGGFTRILYENKLRNVQVLRSPAGQLSRLDFGNTNIDVVFGDPYFGELEDNWADPTNNRMSFAHTGEYMPSKYPWHHFLFGHYLDFMRQKGVINSNVKIIPGGATLKGMAVKFESLHKINAPINRVFNDLFDFRDYIGVQQNAVNKGRMDHQYLWQYPATCSSLPFDIMKFDFQRPLESKSSEGLIALNELANGVALWVEWELSADNKVSTAGPISEVQPGSLIDWSMHTEQGVYYLWEHCNDTMKFKVDFTHDTLKFDFNFSEHKI